MVFTLLPALWPPVSRATAFLQPPRTRLKLPSNLALPSPMVVFSLILLTYFSVVSGLVYDVIVEPPGIGSSQDPATGAVRPVVFLPGRVNGQYIIEGLSSGFMFLLGGGGVILLDLAVDRTRPGSLRVSFGGAGVAAMLTMVVVLNLDKLGKVERGRTRCYAMAPARCMSLNLTVRYADVINSVVLQVTH